MTQDMITSFFGWMTILNIGFLGLTSISVLAFQSQIAALHGRMFEMEISEVKKAYFRYLANYKILTFVFCIAPWIALKLV